MRLEANFWRLGIGLAMPKVTSIGLSKIKQVVEMGVILEDEGGIKMADLL